MTAVNFSAPRRPSRVEESKRNIQFNCGRRAHTPGQSEAKTNRRTSSTVAMRLSSEELGPVRRTHRRQCEFDHRDCGAVVDRLRVRERKTQFYFGALNMVEQPLICARRRFVEGALSEALRHCVVFFCYGQHFYYAHDTNLNAPPSHGGVSNYKVIIKRALSGVNKGKPLLANSARTPHLRARDRAKLYL